MQKQITMRDISKYLGRVNCKTSLAEWKKITIELRDKFNLTDFEAINIMSYRVDAIIKVLQKKSSLAATRKAQ